MAQILELAIVESGCKCWFESKTLTWIWCRMQFIDIIKLILNVDHGVKRGKW